MFMLPTPPVGSSPFRRLRQELPIPRRLPPALPSGDRPDSPRAMAQTVVLRVGMSCEGCVGAVKRVLGKMEGVDSFDVDIKEQKVTVKGNVTPDAVLQTVSKTGKKTSFWEAEPVANQSAAPADATA